jgi:hypothetical protein
MEPGGSLPHSQMFATCPYPEPGRSGPYPTPHTASWNIHLTIILPSTPESPKWPLSLRFPHQNRQYVSPVPHMRYMPRPAHSSQFYCPNNTRIPTATNTYSEYVKLIALLQQEWLHERASMLRETYTELYFKSIWKLAGLKPKLSSTSNEYSLGHVGNPRPNISWEILIRESQSGGGGRK